MAVYQQVTQPFKPIYDAHSKILILGSFPSVKSREEGFYYGNKRNRFWKVLAAICSTKIPTTVEEKKNLLLQNRIALYDVIECCEIKGSSDSSIRNVIPANLYEIIKNSDINLVITNGRLAGKLYKKYQSKELNIEMIELPSTSPANAAFSEERLIELWGNKIKLQKKNEGE